MVQLVPVVIILPTPLLALSLGTGPRQPLLRAPEVFGVLVPSPKKRRNDPLLSFFFSS